MPLILVLAAGIALVNPEGKEARCAAPATREEATALMQAMPAPKDFGAFGALTATYNMRRISLVEYCARRYELAGYSRRIEPDTAAGSGTQSYANPAYPWSVSYPVGWNIDASKANDVRLLAPDGSALCGIHSAEVRFKAADEYADFMLAFNERHFKERGVMLTGTGKRPMALAGGVTGIEVITDMSNGGRSRRVFVLAEPLGYVIDCETYTGSWERYEPVFARIIASLSFRKP
jgi:hypothetical protein